MLAMEKPTPRSPWGVFSVRFQENHNFRVIPEALITLSMDILPLNNRFFISTLFTGLLPAHAFAVFLFLLQKPVFSKNPYSGADRKPKSHFI